MLGTLLEVEYGDSRIRFARELVSFVRSGMRARATETARTGALRVVADGVGLSGIWLLALFLSSELGTGSAGSTLLARGIRSRPGPLPS